MLKTGLNIFCRGICRLLTSTVSLWNICPKSWLFLVFPDLSRTYTQDGVCLTESGLCQLQSLSATASRRRKPKPKLKLKIINQNSVAVLQAPVDPLSEHSRDEDMEDNRGTCLLGQVTSFITDCLLEVLIIGLSLLAYLFVNIYSYFFRPIWLIFNIVQLHSSHCRL